MGLQHTHTRLSHIYEYAALQQHIMNSHDHIWYKPIATTVCALYVAAPSEVTFFFIFPTLEDVLTQLC